VDAAELDTPAVGSPDTLQLSFAGDIMAHRVNYSMDAFSDIYENVAEVLHRADLSFANLEFTVDPERPYSTYPRFNVHPEYVAAAIAGGFDVFSLANNHTTDFGRDSIRRTLESMTRLAQSRGIWFSGIRERHNEGFRIRTISAGDWQIAFLAVTLFVNDPSRGIELVNFVDLRDVQGRRHLGNVIAAAARNHDAVVVSVHGGVEYSLLPHPEKDAFLRELAVAGATVVWGHHPHVLQPWSYYRRRNGTNALILHSTGNFISGQIHYLGPDDAGRRRAFTGDSAIFRVTLARFDDGASVAMVNPLHIANVREPSGGFAVYPMDALPELAPQWQEYYRARRRAIVAAPLGD
jgi:poly-gamma-glutamate synthesis protein (capsule biosynthesis protein)